MTSMVFEETVVLTQPFAEVLDRVKAAFAAQGFGTLTEIDIEATLRAKTGREMGRYVILGACNPGLAGRALEVEPQIGVLLPCNVVVREIEDGVAVDAMDPGLMVTVVGNDAMAPIAAEARELVGKALVSLAS
jgi:uncharacterized protein (DUF302 family)